MASENFKAPEPMSKDSKKSVKSLGSDKAPQRVSKDAKSVKSDACEKITCLPLSVYVPPDWGGPPPPTYNVEIIKNGVVIDNIRADKATLLVGRLLQSDIVLEHPSASRYHCVVQYCNKEELCKQTGFYVYDLCSTHGTFLNKQQIKPKIFYKIEVGHVLKFGASSRFYVLQGPENDCDPEETPEEEGCDWGLGKDAEEEEELTDNPFALSVENEELYVDDPKKTLRGWFEREGYELEYKAEEKGYKNFTCSVRLPIDIESGDGFVTVEAAVLGKKKEAVAACALEACRMLDRYGLLRQARHEGRKRKQKDWEAQDYYDSDEDTFLDRTGTIEKKRKFRKKLSKQKEARTHESIVAELEVISIEICEIEKKLNAPAAEAGTDKGDENVDPLDSYMSTIMPGSSKSSLNAVTKSRLRLQLRDLKAQKEELEVLRNMSCPSRLPDMIYSHPKSHIAVEPVVEASGRLMSTDIASDKNSENVESKTQLPLPSEVPGTAKVAECKNGTAANETIKFQIRNSLDSREGALQKLAETMERREVKLLLPSEVLGTDKVTDNGDETARKEKVKFQVRNILDPKEGTLKVGKGNMPEAPGTSYLGNIEVKGTPDVKISEKPISEQEGSGCNDKRNVKKKCDEQQKKTEVEYRGCSEDYSVWMPPANQSGDGTTHLNTKYGY